MYLSSSALFQAGGIHCKILERDPSTGAPTLRDAQAVFVTHSTVKGSRSILDRSGLTPTEIRRQKFNLGDVVVAWVDDKGRQRGTIAPNGADAGVVLPVLDSGLSHLLPLSGDKVFDTYQTLAALHSKGVKLDLHARRAIASIDELFSIVLASPELDRFSDRLRGMAFLASLQNAFGPIASHLSMEALGTYFTASEIRHRISAVDPDHPDSAMPGLSHKELLNELGAKDAIQKGALRSIVQNALGGLSRNKINEAQDPADLSPVLGLLTSTPSASRGHSLLSQQDFMFLRECFAGASFTGPWIDSIQDVADRHAGLSPGSGSGQTEIHMTSKGGLDVLLIQTPMQAASGSGCHLLSWPTIERNIAHRREGAAYLQIAEQEIVSREAMDRLHASLREVTRERSPEPESGEF